MNIESIQRKLDDLYKISLDQAYSYLMETAIKAMNENNDQVLLFALNELIGYYRVTSKADEGKKIADQLINIIYNKGWQSSIAAATSYLNIATMYRAFHENDIALSLYQQTEQIYAALPFDDERLSAFYNNYSLLYLELKQYRQAIELAKKALSGVRARGDHSQEAVSLANLAQMYLAVNQSSKAKAMAKEAIELFERYAHDDSHYFSALAALGQCYFKAEEYEKALSLYDQAIAGVKRIYGQSNDYFTLEANRQEIIKQLNRHHLKGLDLCQRYYETYGQKMIEEKFSSYKPYMAIGMFGFGSDCLGYDDEISTDHDFGGGFCILLPADIYHKIGHDLQNAYDLLPDEFMGLTRRTTVQGQGRVGVFTVDNFFEQFLGKIPETVEDWLNVDEMALLNCTNGRIFVDHLGTVTKIRNYLSYYPEDIRLKKIARALAKMAQSGQYNYARCMKRKAYVAASLALNEFIEQTLALIYLLNKKYKPYYKWSFYGLKDCTVLYELQEDIEKLVLLPCQKEHWHDDSEMINLEDPKIVLIESICQKAAKQLRFDGLSNSNSDFLDVHAYEVMNRIQDPAVKNKHVMEG